MPTRPTLSRRHTPGGAAARPRDPAPTAPVPSAPVPLPVATPGVVRRRVDAEPEIAPLFGWDSAPESPPGRPAPGAALDSTRKDAYNLRGRPEGRSTEKAKVEAPPVDAAKARADLAALATRVAGYPALAGSPFVERMTAYIDAAIAGREKEAIAHMKAALQVLKQRNAFGMTDEVYRTVSLEQATDPAAVEEQVEQAMSGTVLWSKLNKYQAIDAVAGGRGNSLEASAAGALFDGLSFGMVFWQHEVLKKQWKHVSKNFVSGARGIVHGQVFEGLDPESVMSKTEWPVIRQLMRDNVVAAFVIHFFELVDGQLVETSSRTLRHIDEWFELPSVANWHGGRQDYTSREDWVPRRDLEGKVRTDQDGRELGSSRPSGFAERQTTVQKMEDRRNEAGKSREAHAVRFRESRARFVELGAKR